MYKVVVPEHSIIETPISIINNVNKFEEHRANGVLFLFTFIV